MQFQSQGSALFLAANGHPQVLFYWWPCNIMGAIIGEHAKAHIWVINEALSLSDINVIDVCVMFEMILIDSIE